MHDFGTYQCFATNKYGTAVSAAFKIERAWRLGVTPTTTGLVIKSEFRQIRWRGTSIQPNSTPLISSFSDTVEMTLTSAYQFRSVSIPCRGKPKCKPKNECRVEWKLGDGTSNTIYETKRIAIDKDAKPIFQEDETLKSQVISDGQNAVFKCKMESLPFENPPSVPIWRRNGKELYHGQCEFSYLFSI
ncbi:uncharacterized protein LOC127733688 [Mytilus californianus]|uniref:uncharacterized protein LOC127733688 n=1 Tax=Mytilus californianus TaxID=6549 RepID=UPI00224779DB|nr:uncharacterized protein LOC127733688 [Mytilus californianus]